MGLRVGELIRRREPPERLVELGRWLLLWSEMSTLAIGEGYRATEGELLARDVAARRAALDELLGAVRRRPGRATPATPVHALRPRS